MSERLKRIKHLLSLKERKELEAFHLLSKTRMASQQSYAKKKQMMDFCSDYSAQMEKLGKSGAMVSTLKNRILFIEQLEKAQEQIDIQISQLNEAMKVHEKKWLKAKMEYDGVKKLVERISNEEEARTLSLEQKENDEYAQKIWHQEHNRNK